MNEIEIRKILEDRAKEQNKLGNKTVTLEQMEDMHESFERFKKNQYELYKESQSKAYKHWNNQDNAGNFLSSLEYHIGKKKAMECPAFKCPEGKVSKKAICFIIDDKWANQDYQRLFRHYCYKCKLTHEEALKKGIFNGVFQGVEEK